MDHECGKSKAEQWLDWSATQIDTDAFRPTKFKLWYCHQIGAPAYEQEVDSPEAGQKILDAIYQVALYQFNNNMIPDYANTGGIVYLDEDGDWSDYHPEEWTDRARANPLPQEATQVHS